MKEEDKIVRGYVLEGKLNTMANSIELTINKILEKNKIKPEKMLGEKISQVSKLSINKELIRELREFNKKWNIIKHGNLAQKQSIKLDSVGISKSFTKIMNELISICSS